jgi:hypothetical protein
LRPRGTVRIDCRFSESASYEVTVGSRVTQIRTRVDGGLQLVCCEDLQGVLVLLRFPVNIFV